MRRGMAALLLVVGGCAGASKGYEGAPRISQSIGGFNNPESGAFSADGKWLFVTNCASGESGADKRIGLVAGQGAVSKLSVAPDGTLAMANAKFIEGLNGPLGIVAAPRAVGPYPKGALFVGVGNAFVTDEKGGDLKDARKIGAGVAVFDPESGKPLGKVELGPGSPVAVAMGHPILFPNGIAFDREGGLHVADSGFGGDRLEPKVAANPGILRVTLGEKGEVTGHTFTPVAGGPNGVGYHEKENALYWVTCNGQGAEGGSVYRQGRPFAPGVGPSDGVVFTPAGTVVISRFQGDLVAIRKGEAPEPLAFDKKFNFPSDLRLLALPDGSSIIVVPEQEAWNPAPWGQSLKVVRLPAGY